MIEQSGLPDADDVDVVNVKTVVVRPLCLMPVIGQPFPAVHRTLEFRVALVDGQPYFFLTLSGADENDVLVTQLYPGIELAFLDLIAWVNWLMEAPGVKAALGDLAAESFLRGWTAPPVGQ